MFQSQNQELLHVGTYLIDKSALIGKGASANVYRATNQDTGQTAAVKVIDHSTITNQVTQYLLDGEIKAHKTLNSPYTIKTYDVIQQDNFTYIFMEECPSGTLKSYIQNSPQHYLPEQDAIEIFQKIMAGYISIIDSLFIHRDLKTANILIRQNGDPVIIDFGYCEMIMGNKRPMIQYNVGSPSYMSPEAYGKSRYSEKSDIWALGVIYYEMITGKVLDDGMNIKQFFNNIEREGKVRLNTERMNKVSQQILEAALRFTPEERATSHKIKYIIDKSMISVMQAKLNKKTSHNSNSSYSSLRSQPKVISQGHILNNHNLGVKVQNQQNIRSSISVKEKIISAKNNTQGRNNQNSTVIYNSTSYGPPPPKFLQRNSFMPNVPGIMNAPQRRTIDRGMMPPPSIKRIVSVREIGENEKMFLKKNGIGLHKTVSLNSNQSSSPHPNQVVPLSLRII